MRKIQHSYFRGQDFLDCFVSVDHVVSSIVGDGVAAYNFFCRKKICGEEGEQGAMVYGATLAVVFLYCSIWLRIFTHANIYMV